MSHVDLTIARTISCGLNSCLALDFTVTVIISCGFYSHFHHLVDFTVAIIISCGFKKSLSLPSFHSVLPNSFPFFLSFSPSKFLSFLDTVCMTIIHLVYIFVLLQEDFEEALDVLRTCQEDYNTATIPTGWRCQDWLQDSYETYKMKAQDLQD